MPPKSISEMTAGSCVFLTGATGFVGGCILERILKMDPGPERVYVLMRKRNGVDVETRLKKMFTSPLYSGVPAHKFERCRALEGDIGCDAEDLGLSKANVQLLLDTCTHVYHSAAFISFAAQIDQAVRVNLRGTWAVLKLAKRMRKLRAMVHVSTAFCNCTTGTEFKQIQEKIYPTGVDPLEILEAVDNMKPEEMDKKYRGWISRHPNTYSFTKQLTESLLEKERGNVPMSIVRPSVILNSWREPFAGWADNINSGACGFIAGASKGVFYSIQADAKMNFDAIPVDLVASTILASALKAELEPDRLHVLHCTSSIANPTTWGNYVDAVIVAARKHPVRGVAWYPRAVCRPNRIRHEIVVVFFQMIYAVFIDMFSKFIQSGWNVMDVQRRYAKGNKYTSYFGLREWHFERKATDELAKLLTAEDLAQNPIDIRQVNWNKYFEDCVLGTRSYIHKEPAETTESARKHMNRMLVIDAIAPLLSFALLLWCFTSLMGYAWMLAAPAAALLVAFLVWI